MKPQSREDRSLESGTSIPAPAWPPTTEPDRGPVMCLVSASVSSPVKWGNWTSRSLRSPSRSVAACIFQKLAFTEFPDQYFMCFQCTVPPHQERKIISLFVHLSRLLGLPWRTGCGRSDTWLLKTGDERWSAGPCSPSLGALPWEPPTGPPSEEGPQGPCRLGSCLPSPAQLSSADCVTVKCFPKGSQSLARTSSPISGRGVWGPANECASPGHTDKEPQGKTILQILGPPLSHLLFCVLFYIIM